MSNEGRANLRDTVGKRELEVGGQQLLDVGAADVVGLLNLNDLEDLLQQISILIQDQL